MASAVFDRRRFVAAGVVLALAGTGHAAQQAIYRVGGPLTDYGFERFTRFLRKLTGEIVGLGIVVTAGKGEDEYLSSEVTGDDLIISRPADGFALRLDGGFERNANWMIVQGCFMPEDAAEANGLKVIALRFQGKDFAPAPGQYFLDFDVGQLDRLI